MLSSRLTLQCELFSRLADIKKAPTRACWRTGLNYTNLVVKDAETAARKPRRHVAAAEAQRIIRVKRRLGPMGRVKAVRVKRTRAQVTRPNRPVGRKRRGDHFINANPGPRQSTVDSPHHARGHAGVRPFKNPGLFNGTLHLTHTGKLRHIADATAKFLFLTGTTGDQQCQQGKRTKK